MLGMSNHLAGYGGTSRGRAVGAASDKHLVGKSGNFRSKGGEAES
jgi:hypothetical protein